MIKRGKQKREYIYADHATEGRADRRMEYRSVIEEKVESIFFQQALRSTSSNLQELKGCLVEITRVYTRTIRGDQSSQGLMQNLGQIE